jgi:phosphodiesterase/alkaline phosphatase D-like protein
VPRIEKDVSFLWSGDLGGQGWGIDASGPGYRIFKAMRALDPDFFRVLHHGPLLDVFVLDMRWYRDANSPDKQAANDGGILGREQAEWLKRELAASTATWKVISNDMPLTEVVTDTTQGQANFEAVAQGATGSRSAARSSSPTSSRSSSGTASATWCG